MFFLCCCYWHCIALFHSGFRYTCLKSLNLSKQLQLERCQGAVVQAPYVPEVFWQPLCSLPTTLRCAPEKQTAPTQLIYITYNMWPRGIAYNCTYSRAERAATASLAGFLLLSNCCQLAQPKHHHCHMVQTIFVSYISFFFFGVAEERTGNIREQ